MLDTITPKLNSNIIESKVIFHTPHKYKISAVQYTKTFVNIVWTNICFIFPVAIKYASIIESKTKIKCSKCTYER